MEDELLIRRPDDMHPAEWEEFVHRVHDELAERADALPFEMAEPPGGPLASLVEAGKELVVYFGI